MYTWTWIWVDDNKIINTRNIKISKNKISKNHDKANVSLRGTIVMLLVRLKGAQFDLMEKNWQPKEISNFFLYFQFSKNDYFVSIDECKHKQAS